MTWGLRVRDILVVEDSQTISLRDSRSSGRCKGKYYSKAPTKMKIRDSEAIAILNIPMRSRIHCLLRPNSVFPSRNAKRGSLRMTPMGYLITSV